MKHEKDMLARKEDITRIIELYVPSENMWFSYEDLCICPDLNLFEGYKVLKFEMFNDIGYHWFI